MSGAPITAEQRAQVIEAVAKGAHPQVACTAAGLNRSYWKLLRFRARNNEPFAIAFVTDIEAAEAQAEVGAIDAAHRAIQPIDTKPLTCPHCDCEYTADPEQLAALAMRYEGMQKAKSSAAEVALKTLERRHPKRWSQKVVHTIAEEHDRLLSVCERVLAPEVFESLLEEYLSEGEGSGEAGSGSGGSAGDREVH